jgi:predicted amidohydrolase YtcJ
VDGEHDLVLERGGQKGRIQVGQLADLAVLDRDYFQVPGDDISRSRRC